MQLVFDEIFKKYFKTNSRQKVMKIKMKVV